MIDLDRETPVELAKAVHLVPAIAVSGTEAKKPLNPRTLFNWATRGKRGVVLETVEIPDLATTREAILRFIARVAEARERWFATKQQCSQRRMVRRRVVDQQAARERLAARHGI